MPQNTGVSAALAMGQRVWQRPELAGDGLTEEVRTRVHQTTGVAPEAVLLNASHTHSAPPLTLGGGISWTPQDPEYDRYAALLPELLAGAVYGAYYAMRPARVGSASGRAPGISVNRVHHEQPVDDSVQVLRIDTADRVPLAVLASFACHGTCMGGHVPDWNADFAGPLRESLDVQCLFLQGCAGDIAPWDFWMGNPHPRPHTYANRDELGRRLGAEVLRVMRSIQTDENAHVAAVSHVVPLRRRQLAWDAAELALVARALQARPEPDYPELWPEHVHTANSAQLFPLPYQRGAVGMYENMRLRKDEPLAAEVQAIGVGDAGIVGCPFGRTASPTPTLIAVRWTIWSSGAAPRSPRSMRGSHVSQPRVEDIAESVPQKIETHHDDHDRQARKNSHRGG
jgi:hypothetical protein